MSLARGTFNTAALGWARTSQTRARCDLKGVVKIDPTHEDAIIETVEARRRPRRPLSARRRAHAPSASSTWSETPARRGSSPTSTRGNG